jgi:predicted transcriptional regulator
LTNNTNPEPVVLPEEFFEILDRLPVAIDKIREEAASKEASSVQPLVQILREVGQFYRQTEALASHLGDRSQHTPEEAPLCDRFQEMAHNAGEMADKFEALLEGFEEDPSCEES